MDSLLRRALLAGLVCAMLGTFGARSGAPMIAVQGSPVTPIEHLVVIVQENSSFDRVFATYPTATNPPGQPRFEPRRDTPSVNGLSGALLTRNPNGVNPFRIDRTQAYTCDQDHEYSDEQRARNGGLLDRYPEFGAGGPSNDRQYCAQDAQGRYVTDMGYFDGNTVTALWMYAQHFAQRSNPLHTPPASVMEVGRDGPANHLYDLTWFWRAADAGNLPAVAYLKARASQNGHPGNSNPLDEQVWLVETINRLQRLAQWERMAIVIAWDDSDGWYDHVMAPVVNQSSTPLDFGCGERTDGPGGRCAYGPRIPLIVISPWAKENYVSSALSDQTSILRLIEDNWLGGQRISALSFDNIAGSLHDMFDFRAPRMRRLILDPDSGLPVTGP